MIARAIPQVLADLQSAVLALEQRRHEEAQARSAATSALNAVNDLQKELDDLLAAMKKNSPSGSDWHRQSILGTRMPAG